MRLSPNNNIFAWVMAIKDDTKIKPVPEGYNKLNFTNIFKELDNSVTLLSNNNETIDPIIYVSEKHPALIEKIEPGWAVFIVILFILVAPITTIITHTQSQKTIEAVRVELVNMHFGDFVEVKANQKLAEVRDALNEPISNASKKFVGKLWDEYVSLCKREIPIPLEPESFYAEKVKDYLRKELP
jgi:hypothetical protein